MPKHNTPVDLGYEHGPMTLEEYKQFERDMEDWLNQADSCFDDSISERDMDIMIHGYDRDDWRACAAHDYEIEALLSIRRDGGAIYYGM